MRGKTVGPHALPSLIALLGHSFAWVRASAAAAIAGGLAEQPAAVTPTVTRLQVEPGWDRNKTAVRRFFQLIKTNAHAALANSLTTSTTDSY